MNTLTRPKTSGSTQLEGTKKNSMPTTRHSRRTSTKKEVILSRSYYNLEYEPVDFIFTKDEYKWPDTMKEVEVHMDFEN